jgi:hypothetical protein
MKFVLNILRGPTALKIIRPDHVLGRRSDVTGHLLRLKAYYFNVCLLKTNESAQP